MYRAAIEIIAVSHMGILFSITQKRIVWKGLL